MIVTHEHLSFDTKLKVEGKKVIIELMSKDYDGVYAYLIAENGAFKYYREVNVKPRENEEILLEQIKEYLAGQFGWINARMGVTAHIDYEVKKFDENGVEYIEKKSTSQTI